MRIKEKIFRDKKVLIFSFLVILILLIAIFAPLIATRDPYEATMIKSLVSPNSEYFFGTDRLGRDLFSRIIYGARISLLMTFLLVIIVFVVGTGLGIVAGFYEGLPSYIIMRVVDIMISFPGLILAIAIAGILGPNIINGVIAVALVSWPKYARLARSLVLKIRNSTYIEAARVGGAKDSKIIFKYILPNIIEVMITTVFADIGVMMLELAALSFLGFGAQPPMPEWGAMLNEARNYMNRAPWLMMYPGMALVIVVVIFNTLGDSIRDVLDPKE